MSLERLLTDPELAAEVLRQLEQGAGAASPLARLSAARFREATERAAAGRESVLSVEEEAIVRLVGRPVFLIKNDKIVGDLGPIWGDKIETARARLERAIPAVGRIDLSRHPQREWAGTAWLIAPDVVVTNRHVANSFVHAAGGGFVFDADPYGQTVLAEVDFVHEFRSKRARSFEIENALHIEPPGAERPDVALLKIKRTNFREEDTLAAHVALAEDDPQVGTWIGAIGYPERDAMRNDAGVMEELFAGIYRVKRFQPGEVNALKSAYLTHDCSTIGGNSGSVLLDFATGRAVGLHYTGYYERENFAVKCSALQEILREHRIELPRPPPAVPR